MRNNHAIVLTALLGCAKANSAGPDVDANMIGATGSADASCAEFCDTDGDGVLDGNDHCPNTPAGQPVNHVGCSDTQVTSTLVPFPPFDLTWTSSGSLGRAGGLLWTYVNIQRADLFHIDWVICDDPATSCGLSLDGAIDAPNETWTFSPTQSDLANGKLVFTNATNIALADGSSPTLDGRLTLTIADGAAPISAGDVATIHVPPRAGGYGAEIKGTKFTVTALAEVKPTASSTWTPYLDYYDAAATPTAGGAATSSYGGSFYAK